MCCGIKGKYKIVQFYEIFSDGRFVELLFGYGILNKTSVKSI